MANINIEEGIDRLIGYTRRMNLLNDEQLRLLLGVAIQRNPDSYTGIGIDIEGHINWIRQMAILTDDQIRSSLAQTKDPLIIEIFEDSAKKKALLAMQEMAKDIKSNAKFIARKVDEL